MILEVLNLDPSLVWPRLRTIIIDGRAEPNLKDSGGVLTTNVIER